MTTIEEIHGPMSRSKSIRHINLWFPEVGFPSHDDGRVVGFREAAKYLHKKPARFLLKTHGHCGKWNKANKLELAARARVNPGCRKTVLEGSASGQLPIIRKEIVL